MVKVLMLRNFINKGSNQLQQALLNYIRIDLRKRAHEIDSPEFLENLLDEWLATVGATFKRCLPHRILLFNLPFEKMSALRVYREDNYSGSLSTLMIIGFLDDDPNPNESPTRLELDVSGALGITVSYKDPSQHSENVYEGKIDEMKIRVSTASAEASTSTTYIIRLSGAEAYQQKIPQNWLIEPEKITQNSSFKLSHRPGDRISYYHRTDTDKNRKKYQGIIQHIDIHTFLKYADPRYPTYENRERTVITYTVLADPSKSRAAQTHQVAPVSLIINELPIKPE